MQVMVAQLSQENCRWDGRGRELKLSVERGESGARGESRPPAEQRKRAKRVWGVWGCWTDTWANASRHICPLLLRSLRCWRSVLGLQAWQDRGKGGRKKEKRELEEERDMQENRRRIRRNSRIRLVVVCLFVVVNKFHSKTKAKQHDSLSLRAFLIGQLLCGFRPQYHLFLLKALIFKNGSQNIWFHF